MHPWMYTKDPTQGNDWRVKAKGHRVVALMMWLYCDDTSGNLSKKWNKHNSFLWTPAGLPRHMAQKQYNVHFLSTSNIAPPLEMLDGVVTELESVFTIVCSVGWSLISMFTSGMHNGMEFGHGMLPYTSMCWYFRSFWLSWATTQCRANLHVILDCEGSISVGHAG